MDASDEHHQPLSPLALELPHVAAPLATFLALSPALDPSPSVSTPGGSQQDASGSAQHTDSDTLVTQEVQLDADSAAALTLPPILMPRHCTYQLSEKGILEMTGISLLGMLTQLNLHGSALKKIEVGHHA